MTWLLLGGRLPAMGTATALACALGIAASAQAQTQAALSVTGLQAQAFSLYDGSALTVQTTLDEYHEAAVRFENAHEIMSDVDRTPALYPAHAALSNANATAGTTLASLYGPYTFEAAIVEGQWNSAYSFELSHIDFLLPPQSALTVRGHVHASYDAPVGTGGFLFGTQLNAFTGTDGYTIQRSGLGSDTLDQDFSITARNTSNSSIRVTWSTDGSVTASLLAVPEPGQWAMLLAGLGLVAPLARRTRRR